MDLYIDIDRSITLSLSSSVTYTSSDDESIVETVMSRIGSCMDISEYNEAKSYSAQSIILSGLTSCMI